MHGFTTTLPGITFDQALRSLQAVRDIRLLLPCNRVVREEAPGRIRLDFLGPQTVESLVGKPEVQSVADATEWRLPSARARLADKRASVRTV